MKNFWMPFCLGLLMLFGVILSANSNQVENNPVIFRGTDAQRLAYPKSAINAMDQWSTSDTQKNYTWNGSTWLLTAYAPSASPTVNATVAFAGLTSSNPAPIDLSKLAGPTTVGLGPHNAMQVGDPASFLDGMLFFNNSPTSAAVMGFGNSSSDWLHISEAGFNVNENGPVTFRGGTDYFFQSDDGTFYFFNTNSDGKWVNKNVPMILGAQQTPVPVTIYGVPPVILNLASTPTPVCVTQAVTIFASPTPGNIIFWIQNGAVTAVQQTGF